MTFKQIDMKVCSTCKEVKTLDFFCKDKYTPTGLGYHCRPCKTKAVSKYRKNIKKESNIKKYTYGQYGNSIRIALQKLKDKYKQRNKSKGD